MSKIEDLLAKYRVDRDFQKEIREEYRSEIASTLSSAFDIGTRIHFRYGGSLAKGTANTNSCDIDLLCYLESDSTLTLKQVYESAEKALRDKGYNITLQNSAIKIYGKAGDSEWDITVDVVPGRYISNEGDDVNLWCRKDNKSLKTNPETQINKVKQSKSKDVIRALKLFRDFNQFKFKSFFLEIFTIDVVQNDFKEEDSLIDKLIKFCSHYDDIGVKKINDPANSNNDIMSIHSEWEFENIRKYIKKLYDALMTDDEIVIESCILNKPYDENEGYRRNAKNHSYLINFKQNQIVPYFNFTIQGYYASDNTYSGRTIESTELAKDIYIKFIAFVPDSVPVKSLGWIICNAGYEAKKAGGLRGKRLEESDKTLKVYPGRQYIKNEHTLYHGDHFAQAKLETKTGRVYYSNIIVVKIRK